MPQNSSQIDENQKVKDFWLPTFPEVLFYFVISTVWFGVMNAQTLWQFFNLRVLGADLSVSSDFSPLTAPLFDFINNHDTWVMLVIWGIIGCVVFGLVIFLQNIFRTAKQEVAESQYRVGGTRANPNYWHNVARLDLSSAGLAIGWIVYLAMYLNGIMPWVSQTFFTGLDAHWTQGYKIVLALLVNTGAIYLLAKFTRILLSAWQLIRPNE